MISIKELLIITFLTSLTSCVSTPKVNTEYWENLVNSDQFQNEKKTYEKRWNDKIHCWEQGVSDYLTEASYPPVQNCIYPSSKLVIQYSEGKKVTGQKLKQLKVMQVTPDGFLVTSADLQSNKLIFIKKTDETNIVDGSYLDEANWTRYEYVGTYSYKTVIGSKTIHSFKKVTAVESEDKRKNLKVYNPLIEYWVQYKLWYYLEEIPTPYANK